MKEEEGKCNTVVEAFQVAEKSLQETKKKLQKEQNERKYAVAALENAEKQAEKQRLQLRGVEDQLATTKTKVATLKKKLKEAEKAKVLAEEARDEAVKAKDVAEQHEYDVGVAKTEDTLRAKVLAVCRTYCALVWDEALNQAEVEASSMLRKAESIYYPPAICPQSSSDSMADPPKVPLAIGTITEGVEQTEDTSKAGEVNREAVQGSELPPPAPRDTSKEKETSESMELLLVTFTIPPKEDPMEKAEVSTTTASTQLPKDPKDKLVIKMKK